MSTAKLKKCRKRVSLVLAVALLFGCVNVPFCSFADDERSAGTGVESSETAGTDQKTAKEDEKSNDNGAANDEENYGYIGIAPEGSGDAESDDEGDSDVNAIASNNKITVTYKGFVSSFKPDGTYPAENLHGIFTGNKLSGVVYCGEHGLPTPMGETIGNKGTYTMVKYTDNAVRKVLYYGYKGPKQWSGFANSKYNKAYLLLHQAKNKTQACGISVTAMALTKAFNNAGGGTGRVYGGISGMTQFWNYIKSQPNPPSGFTVYRIKTASGKQDFFTWINVSTGKLTLKKSVTGNIDQSIRSKYPITGATYSVKNSAGTQVGTLTTKADGTTNTLTLNAGKYTVKETKAPAGYALDTKTYTVTVNANATVTVQSGETMNAGHLTLKKAVNAGTKEQEIVKACGDMYSLAGAKYDVRKGSKQIGTLTTKADGTTNTLNVEAGIYKVKETTAPKGYQLDTATYTVTVEPGKTATVNSKDVPLFDPLTAFINKTPSETPDKAGTLNKDQNMNGAVFTVKYYANQLNDESGQTPVRTWKLHDHKVGNEYRADLSQECLESGSDPLFINSSGQPVLPRGTVTIQETKAPTGYEIDPTVGTYHVEENDSGTVRFNVDDKPVVKADKALNPEIHTSAVDGNTKDHTGKVTKEGETTTITDTVTYTDLTPDLTYTVKGRLMDSDGNPLKDKDGNEITAQATLRPTTANSTVKNGSASGKMDLTFTFDSSILAGKSTVVYEDLYLEDTLIAKHENPKDEDQTVHYPDVKTNAVDSATNDHESEYSKTETIVDTVTYHNLIPGKEYTVKGKLMDRKTGKPLLDKDGHEITAEKTFTPDRPDGTVELEFTLDSTLRQGEDTVVFEDLYHNDIEVGTHSDITDENQTVHHPDVKTTAKDNETGDNVGTVTKENVLVDTVTYSGLTPGKEYTVRGTLMDKETGEALKDKDGKEITAEKKFTPDESNSTIGEDGLASGTVELEFHYDTTERDAKETVVFEDLYNEKDVLVGAHADIEDDGQTVVYPEVKTTAKDKTSDSHSGTYGKEVTIVDTVHYSGLIAGKEYTVKGKLMDKAKNEPLKDADGNEITAEKTFIPDETNSTIDEDGRASGDIELEFTFDSTLLQGETIVVFEDLYHNDKLVDTHSDINDEEQSIHYPLLKTVAEIRHIEGEDPDGPIEKTALVVDVINYYNVIPGEKYIIEGKMMDRKTGEPVLYNGKELADDVLFTPEKTEGVVENDFEIPVEVIESRAETVLYEDLYMFDNAKHDDNMRDEKNYTHVASDDDLNNIDETVGIATLDVKHIEETPTETVEKGTPDKPYFPKTGDSTGIFIITSLFAAALAELVIIILIRRRKSGKDKKEKRNPV